MSLNRDFKSTTREENSRSSAVSSSRRSFRMTAVVSQTVESSSSSSYAQAVSTLLRPDTAIRQSLGVSNLTQDRIYPETSRNATSINLDYRSPYDVNRQLNTFQTYTLPQTSLTARNKESSPKPKLLVVKKTGKVFHKSPITYNTTSKHRGEMIIINNIEFKDKDFNRSGAKEDDKQLQQLFAEIGFKVNKHRNLKASEIESKIRNFSWKSSLKTADIAVIAVMSHGRNVSGAPSGTEIYGTDKETISIDTILNYFTDANCKHMKDKPKIFIFQCCRGENEQLLDKPTPSTSAALRDTLIAYSTIPAHVSYRHEDTGSWYIQILCEVFSEHAHEYHVEKMLKIVKSKLELMSDKVKQTSSYDNRGFNECYLHPR